MAFQGRRPRRKSSGAGRVLETDQNFLTTRNIIHGLDEGACALPKVPQDLLTMSR